MKFYDKNRQLHYSRFGAFKANIKSLFTKKRKKDVTVELEIPSQLQKKSSTDKVISGDVTEKELKDVIDNPRDEVFMEENSNPLLSEEVSDEMAEYSTEDPKEEVLEEI